MSNTIPVGDAAVRLLRMVRQTANDDALPEPLEDIRSTLNTWWHQIENQQRADAALVERADLAVFHILDLVQLNPDVRWHLGFGSESFARLCRYQASRRGQDEETVRNERSRDLQADYCRRDPEILVLRSRVEELEAQLRRHAVGV